MSSGLSRVSWIVASTVAVLVARLTVPEAVQVGIGFVFLIPVGLSAWWFGRAWGLVSAAVCLGLLIIGVLVEGVEHPVVTIAVRALVLVAGVLLISEMRGRTLRLSSVRGELEWMQAALTPTALPQLPGVEIGVSYVAAERGVSGDFYLVTNSVDGSNVTILGDVCGHGLEAARMATFARATLASLAANTSEPGELLTLANQTLTARWPSFEALLTAVCLSQHPEQRTLRWALAGHPPPIRLSDLAQLDDRQARGVPLGAFPGFEYQQAECAFPLSECVVLYTDGVTEARSQDQLFGQQRLADVLAAHQHQPPQVLADQIRDAVLKFSGGPARDDVCVVAVRSAPMRG